MKNRLMWACLLGLTGAFAVAQEASELKDPKAKVSYSIGMNLGLQLGRDDVPVDPDSVLRGLKDAIGGKPLLSEAEMRTVLQDFVRQLQAQREEKRKLQGETNRVEGEKYLTENKAKPGVVTLPSGLQYKILTPGSGESPKSNDLATVHYRGTLIDGKEFDSSHSRGQPATFAVNRVIRGWTEALQLMKPGAKWQLTIPSALAYGENGSGPLIGPNATLLFDVELISWKAPEPPPLPPTGPPQAVTSDIIKVPSKEEMEKGAKIEIIKKEDVDKLVKEQQKPSAPEKK